MSGKPKITRSRKNTDCSTSRRCFVFRSKRGGETTLTCRVCTQEFVVPSNTTIYRCNNCRDVTMEVLNTNGLSLRKLLSSSTASSSPPSNKRAVLCGVTYGKRKFKLEGTVNDVNNIKRLLLDKFQFPIQCIRVLTEEKDPSLIPTKRNIEESLKWLVRDCQSGDSLVFYFSGHGLQQPEFDRGDEIDGLDETICPLDFITEGMITDNEINSMIVQPLQNGVRLHAILDTCHSGTTLDLMYAYKREKGSWKWEGNKLSKAITDQTSGGVAICLSACEDSQVAADTAGFDRNGMNGIMTYLFSKIIREHSQITYGCLLQKLHEEIGNIRQSKFSNGILKRIFNRKIEQDPLLSSSKKFDVSTTIFKL
ncbi:hypothetical protein RJT34_13423 [Clitoria ternatea]|uniref:Peptidase C14 caspase domain-containing protein n=1 Tax=Clitoria ternatea TaxID=43366 RepID=A0AAN9JQK9_CLITE